MAVVAGVAHGIAEAGQRGADAGLEGSLGRSGPGQYRQRLLRQTLGQPRQACRARRARLRAARPRARTDLTGAADAGVDHRDPGSAGLQSGSGIGALAGDPEARSHACSRLAARAPVPCWQGDLVSRPDPGLSLQEGWHLSRMSFFALWLSYLALGGDADGLGLDAYVHGALRPDDRQHDVIAQALNVHLAAARQGPRVAYRLHGAP
jgi:hypothetical protein